MDLSKVNLPQDVRPEWRDTGVPACMDDTCPSYDGKRCRATGFRPGDICEPAVEALAAAIPGFLTCERCKGSGTVDRDCSLCGDSTYDHECDDGPAPCPRCNGTGKPQGTEGA